MTTKAGQATRRRTYPSVDAFVTLRTADVAGSEGARAELVEELEVAARARVCACRRWEGDSPGLEAGSLDSPAAALAPRVDDRLKTFAAGVVGVARTVASGRHALVRAGTRLRVAVACRSRREASKSQVVAIPLEENSVDIPDWQLWSQRLARSSGVACEMSHWSQSLQ